MQVTKGLPMERYLALPAVSASLIKLIVDECPAAAFHESWLGPEKEPDDTDASDAGTIAHSILLEGGPGKVCMIDPNDHPAEKTDSIPDGWTNKSIRSARDAARAQGLIPVLTKDMAVIEAMVASARTFIDSLKDSEPAIWAAFQPEGGESELTVQWATGINNAGAVPCRIRPDRISTDRKLIVDLKTSKRSTNPYQWEPDHTGAAFYRMGCEAAFGESVDYVFLLLPQDPPYLPSLVGCDPHQMELGREKAVTGLDLWARCVQANKWPAWPNRVVYPEVKPWVDAQWLEKQAGNQYDYETMFGGKSA